MYISLNFVNAIADINLQVISLSLSLSHTLISNHTHSANLTPEQRLQWTLAANRVNAPTALPAFMNPSAMNPLKFQDIKQKRKLLWSGKKTQKVNPKLSVGNCLKSPKMD